jgi:hypothetical protein
MLGDVAGTVEEGLLAMNVATGMAAMPAMFAAEITTAVGPIGCTHRWRGRWNSGSRFGSVSGLPRKSRAGHGGPTGVDSMRGRPSTVLSVSGAPILVARPERHGDGQSRPTKALAVAARECADFPSHCGSPLPSPMITALAWLRCRCCLAHRPLTVSIPPCSRRDSTPRGQSMAPPLAYWCLVRWGIHQRADAWVI